MDGIDISHILFADYANHGAGSEATAGHDCYFFYKYAVAADAKNALAAVRCGDHKAYYLVDGGPPGSKALRLVSHPAFRPSRFCSTS
jgi:hypothetical protein